MELPDFDQVEKWFAAKEFGHARRHLLAWADVSGSPPDVDLKIVQKLALATYKDNDLQVEQGLEVAYRLLRDRAALDGTRDPETLNLGGAIQKRMWEVAGDARSLTRSLRLYRRAHDIAFADGKLDDWTYSAVNVAFTLDLIAREEVDGSAPHPSERADGLRAEARAARGAVLNQGYRMRADAAEGTWWRAATLAEAHFGLDEVDEAARVVADAIARFDPDDWQQESMARQLAAIASVHYGESGGRVRALEAVAPLVKGPAARAIAAGKVGLALSGGGFRAALFHVGTLARLAELDLLRHVDVISCVSGGSILGALYYLELQGLLCAKRDAEVGRADYVAVVEKVRARLVQALQGDLRTRAMVRSLSTALSSRTVETGALLTSELYATGDRPVPTLRDLAFTPCGEADGFNPKRHNWRRDAKVPILVINATTLNTGHNWQFTATWMGEPPTSIEPDIDASERLRRFYNVGEGPPPYKEIPLGVAVSASAAVPGVFRPVALDGLYPDRKVRLADGGVHDNQGVFSLIEQDCTTMVVSDGCGQLDTAPDPSPLAFPVVRRANDILMETVRRGTYRNLLTRVRTRRLRELRYLHLKSGLPTADVTWIGGGPAPGDAVPRDRVASGLDERIQRALAAIRTDLDDFSLNERDALMFAGYRIADRDFLAKSSALAVDPDAREVWPFLRVSTLMEARKAPCPDDGKSDALADELECGRYLFFRAVRLSRPGRWLRRRLGNGAGSSRTGSGGGV